MHVNRAVSWERSHYKEAYQPRQALDTATRNHLDWCHSALKTGNVPARRHGGRVVAAGPDGKRSVTLRDIAAQAQVSTSTASRVLNGSSASPATRARVLAAVAAHGYRVNSAARSLRTTRSALIGLLVPAINHAVFAEIAERLDRELHDQGLTLAITSSGWNEEGEIQALDALTARGVDLLVLALSNDRSPRIARYLKASPAPIVLLDREVRGLAADAVLTDHQSGTRQAVDHLATLGHQRIGLLHTPLSVRPGREALAAYQEAVHRHQLSADPALLVQSTGADSEAVRRAVAALLASGATAVVIGGSTSAVAAVLLHIEETGLRVPEDLSLITYDDIPLATLKRPRLTTIARPIEAIGRYASHLAVVRLGLPDAPPRIRVVHTRIEIRDSTAACPPS